MNVLPPAKASALHAAFSRGVGVRAAAREVGCNRSTAAAYRRKWIDAELQRAYDVLWDGDGDGCDAITAKLPAKDVTTMLDAWLDDQCGHEPKSKWY